MQNKIYKMLISKKIYFLLILMICTNILSSCNKSNNAIYENNETEPQDTRSIILENDYTNEKRNQLLKEDIVFLSSELPKRHINMFTNISRDEFNNQIAHLINRIDRLENEEIFVEIDKIIASIEDGHTYSGAWTLYNYRYPITLYEFEDGIYVINADKNLKDILYSKVVKMNGMNINYVKEQLIPLIPHENDNFVKNYLSRYMSIPMFMYGLGISDKDKEILITFEKGDGSIVEKLINTVDFDKFNPYFSYENERNVYLFNREYEDFYWYEYIPKYNTFYFKYNKCHDMDTLSFREFNNNMFKTINSLNVDKFVVDLRNNAGGSDIVIEPFLNSLSKYLPLNPETDIFIITGRETFSAGITGVLDIKRTLENIGRSAIIVGEATGGSPNSYGEVLSFELPNSRTPVQYSTKNFSLASKEIQTIKPDIELFPSINDFKDNKDVFMNYILNIN